MEKLGKNVCCISKSVFFYSDGLKFVIMDFEFTMINTQDLLLVSGAMVNSLDKYRPQKLQGRPIILTKTGKLQMFPYRSQGKVVSNVRRIFKKKPEIANAFLKQFNQSIGTTKSVLSTPYITRYLHTDDRAPIVVFWAGNTDKIVMDRLKIPGVRTYLNITNYSKNNDNQFSLILGNMNNTQQIMYEIDIGYFAKNGRILTLKEAHDIICHKTHEITYCHDPVTDVILTRCIFKYLITKMRPATLYRLCGILRS